VWIQRFSSRKEEICDISKEVDALRKNLERIRLNLLWECNGIIQTKCYSKKNAKSNSVTLIVRPKIKSRDTKRHKRNVTRNTVAHTF
jgi:hypothetical protein